MSTHPSSAAEAAPAVSSSAHPQPSATPGVSRRDFVKGAGALAAYAGLQTLLPGWARAMPNGPTAAPGVHALQPTYRGNGRVEYDLEIARTAFEVAGRRAEAITVNGTVPGPLIRLQEGEEAVLRYHNSLNETSSIHWHGLILPNRFDGVPGVNYPGVAPGETFEVRFPVRQYGTYWYHSHSGVQEQLGHLGPLLIDPAGGDPIDYDRELVVVLTDWTFNDPHQIFANLKKGEDYYNFQKRTVGDFWRDVFDEGFLDTLKDRLAWKRMRMSRTDLQAVRGTEYTYLMNGHAPGANWTGLFAPGERVRLRFINASFSTIFDVRVPGLPMEVVQVSGQHVEPVMTDEFRIGTAERYDVIVEPTEDRAYTVFAESLSRSGYARGTLAPRAGMEAPVPDERERPLLTMADMGMKHGSGSMDHGGMAMGAAAGAGAASSTGGMDHGGMAHGEMKHGSMDHGPMKEGAMAGGMMASNERGLRAPGTLPEPVMHDPDNDHGPKEAGIPMMTRSRLDEPGVGLGDDGWRVLTYSHLKARDAKESFAAPTREIELHLTGNMERFIWSIDGKEFSEDELVRLQYGERVRLILVNDTMMNHPMHLHGMFMELENGHGRKSPLVDTVLVKPAERVSLLVTANEPGPWFFHCHIIWHMKAGMARVFYVEPPEGSDEDFYYDHPSLT
ncbi:copper resistance system multicopper oxidase [Salisaeta longa]|uniref:copper resistance system multicopper oxidase n=1 Tax=Salisaeta longa TaxID=503170 RepID=UPI0003B467A5|nr:copper resistance system multicopper oxidase [Salisaeta longa]